MTNLEPRSVEDVEATARAWVLKLASGHATADDAHAARAWMTAHPTHQAAFNRARDLWHETDALEDTFRQSESEASTRWQKPLAMAAAALIAILVPVIAPYLTTLGADYRSASREVSLFALADGSEVWLDSDAAINVTFTEQRREIELLRGRAFFAVAKDRNRPFSVTAGGGTATAVGTAFSVTLNPDGAAVVVEEGRVHTTIGNSTALLSPGEAGGWSANQLQDTHGANLRTSHAWLHGRIIIENQPLSTAVAELDRYRPGIVIVRDRGDVPVSGQFDIARVDDALTVLAVSQQLTVSHYSPWITVLSR